MYLAASLGLAEEGAHDENVANVGHGVKDIKDSDMDEAVALSVDSAIGNNQEPDDEYHDGGDDEAIGDEVKDPGDDVAELGHSHDLLELLLVGLLLSQPPHRHCPRVAGDGNAQVERRGQLVGTGVLSDDYEDRQDDHCYVLAQVLPSAQVYPPILCHYCSELPSKHTQYDLIIC
jgi:hypothetical protein